MSRWHVDRLVAAFEGLGHPVRIYLLLSALEEGEITAATVASRYGLNASTVAGHARYLVERELLTVARREIVRGATRFVYCVEDDFLTPLSQVLAAFETADGAIRSS